MSGVAWSASTINGFSHFSVRDAKDWSSFLGLVLQADRRFGMHQAATCRRTVGFTTGGKGRRLFSFSQKRHGKWDMSCKSHSLKQTYPLFEGNFASMIFLFQRWNISVRWRVLTLVSLAFLICFESALDSFPVVYLMPKLMTSKPICQSSEVRQKSQLRKTPPNDLKNWIDTETHPFRAVATNKKTLKKRATGMRSKPSTDFEVTGCQGACTFTAERLRLEAYYLTTPWREEAILGWLDSQWPCGGYWHPWRGKMPPYVGDAPRLQKPRIPLSAPLPRGSGSK